MSDNGRKERVITLTFKLNKATKNALQYAEVPRDGEPERMGSLYLKKWVVPQPYADQITATVTIPVGKSVTEGGSDPSHEPIAA